MAKKLVFAIVFLENGDFKVTYTGDELKLPGYEGILKCGEQVSMIARLLLFIKDKLEFEDVDRYTDFQFGKGKCSVGITVTYK